MNTTKNKIVVIKKSIRTRGIKQKCNNFSVSSSVKDISLLKTGAFFKKAQRISVLKMREPDVEHNALLNRFPGYCQKALIEEPYPILFQEAAVFVPVHN